MAAAWQRGFRAGGVFVGICLLLLCPAAARGQRTMGPYRDVGELPDTPAAKRVQEFVEVVNSGDAERQRKFCEEALAPAFRDELPMDVHLGFLADVHRFAGRLRFHSVRSYDEPLPEGEIVAILHAELPDAWRGLQLRVEPEPPHRIASLMLMPARPPSDLPAPGILSEEELVAELRAFLDRLVAADRFSGAVLLAKDGKVLFKHAYGQASKRFDVPNRIDTKFNLGSMNKMFTAVAIGQLVERGKLSFDDPVSKYLSADWLPRDVAEKVTVRHLLTHTSGLGSYFNEKFDKSSRMLFRDLEDYKPLVEGERPSFEPGSGWQYSNTGFLLLGVIIEKVTGMSYFDYVQQNICGPAGMINTACYEMDRPVPNLAMGYSKVGRGEDAHWENNLYKHVIRGASAGGGFSTVEDLLRFDHAMRANKLVKAETAALLWTPTELSEERMSYGMGFGIEGEPGNRIVGHGGGFPGISAKLDMYLDKGYTVAVMSNYDAGALPVAEKLRDLIARVE